MMNRLRACRDYMALLVLAVMFALSGCATQTPTRAVTVVTPPDSLLQDCAHAPRPADNTVNGLMLGLIGERSVVESCDWADKAALRSWKAGVQAAQATK